MFIWAYLSLIVHYKQAHPLIPNLERWTVKNMKSPSSFFVINYKENKDSFLVHNQVNVNPKGRKLKFENRFFKLIN